MGMELAINELPLALFSTLAPMGAGAFLLLAISACTGSFDAAITKKADKLTVIPLIFVIVGFICAFFHLSSPLNAFGVFANIGGSPMSNEILVGCIFTVVAIICWIVLMCAKPGAGARKALLCVTAILGLVFCVFVGLAYGMDTIPSWNIPVVPLAVLCFGILGGCAVGAAVLRHAGVAEMGKALSSAVTVLAAIGVLGSVIFFAVQMGMVSGMSNNMMLGSDLVGQLMPCIVIAIILLIAAGVLVAYCAMKNKSAALLWVAVVIAFVAILLARLCFYGVEMSVGLGI